EFTGDASDPDLSVNSLYEAAGGRLTGNLALKVMNDSSQAATIQVIDNVYNTPTRTRSLEPRSGATLVIDLSASHGWYDLSLKVPGNDRFVKRYAGRIETGRPGLTDPAMGRTEAL